MTEFQSPNHDPDSHKRLIIVFALTFLAIIISQQVMERYGPKPAAKTESPVAEQKMAPASAPATPDPSSNQAKSAISAQPADHSSAPAPVANQQSVSESKTVVENDLYKITLSNRGAVVTSWILKQQTDKKGNPLEMVHGVASPIYGYPLSLFTYDEELRNRMNQALYVTASAGKLAAPASVTFDYAADGLTVRKTISFDHSFIVKIETTVTNHGSPVTALVSWPTALGDQHDAPGYGAAQISWFDGNEIHRKSSHEGFFLTGKTSISHGSTWTGPFYWAGLTDSFFAAVFLPEAPAKATLVQFHQTIPQDPNEKDPAKLKQNVFSVLGAAVGATGRSSSVRLFVGPKRLDVLQKIHASALEGGGASEAKGPDLENVVDFGFFGVIAKPLFLWLKWTHDHWVGNWGWAIILLTIIINLVLFPLRYTSMKSALLQQKIAPELKAINYRYKDVKSLTDPRQQDKQREIQVVMKREGINPISGCIPMLIQLPFLFAFYSMLMSANELRNANFLWVKDLSSPDPLYILPVSIVVSMYLMQKITPMTGMDPAQAKMMQVMMPIMIGAISWSLPAGLGVYWVAGNLIGYALQWGMNNSKTAREIRDHLAKRDSKRKK